MLAPPANLIVVNKKGYMKKGLVSVVLPIYNVEKYLDDCIRSIVNQTYTDLEIILVDDGSTDRSPRICDEWARRDERIKVFHKQNEGQGIARNVGIDNANGEYICFFDSDDYVDLQTIEKAYSLAQRDNSEIVVYGIAALNADNEQVSLFLPIFPKSCYRGDEVREDFFPEYLAPDPNGDGNGKFFMSSCPMLYSMELINKVSWHYVSERVIISEDVYSLIELFRYVSSVSVLSEALYCCRANENSFSRSYRADRYERIRHFYLEAKKLCIESGYNDNVIHRVSKPFLGYTLSTLKQECMPERTLAEAKEGIKRIIDDSVLQTVLKENRKDKIGITKKILFTCIRFKMYWACLLLLNGKRLISRR